MEEFNVRQAKVQQTKMKHVKAQQAILCLPGWGMERYVWEPIMKELQEVGPVYHIEWQHMKHTKQFKQQAQALIQQHENYSFTVFGWSLGALVALELALEQLEQPSQINQLILIGATPCFLSQRSEGYLAGWPKRVVERMKGQLEANKKEVLKQFYAAMFSVREKEQGYHSQFEAFVDKHFQGDTILSLQEGLNYLIEVDLRTSLSDIALPVTLIQGEKDTICPPEAAQYMADKLPNVSLHILEGAGHMPFFTCTKAFNLLLRQQEKRI